MNKKEAAYFVRHKTEIHMIIPGHSRESKVHKQVTTDTRNKGPIIATVNKANLPWSIRPLSHEHTDNHQTIQIDVSHSAREMTILNYLSKAGFSFMVFILFIDL